MRGGPATTAFAIGVLTAAAADAAAPGFDHDGWSTGLVIPAAERSTSARCRGLAARLRSLAVQESNARDTASRDRGGGQRGRAEVRLRRNMVRQAGCNLPMKPGDPRARRCFELKSRLRMAEQRANSRPVYGATSTAISLVVSTLKVTFAIPDMSDASALIDTVPDNGVSLAASAGTVAHEAGWRIVPHEWLAASLRIGPRPTGLRSDTGQSGSFPGLPPRPGPVRPPARGPVEGEGRAEHPSGAVSPPFSP